MKKQILLIIADTHPYSYKEVKKVYDRVQSYDATIKILRKATEEALDPLDLARVIVGFKDYIRSK